MWFSVKENLPLPNTKVLTYSPELGVDAHRIQETNSGKFSAWVTHWIPLPVPPTAEDRGVAALQTANSRYVTALSVYREFSNSIYGVTPSGFRAWVEERLNATK